jgi:hypothetical protein
MASLSLIHFASHHAAHALLPSHIVHAEWLVAREDLRFHRGGQEGENKSSELHH